MEEAGAIGRSKAKNVEAERLKKRKEHRKSKRGIVGGIWREIE